MQCGCVGRGDSVTRAWCGRSLFTTMAVNVLMPLLIPLGEQITNVTQLTTVGNLTFSQPWYEVFVKENSAPVLLLTLKASSNTTDAGVTYSMVTGSVGGLFSLNSHVGHLTLTLPLDYESKHTYEMIVGGQAGIERTFARVVVHVRDVNDLPPTFSRPLFETQITEEDDRHLPKPILQVSAEDGDVSDREHLVYTLTGDGVATINSSFAVSTNSGHIRLLRPLDRDEPTGRARWELTVSASDGDHTASAVVHVNVKDINDNAPFFPSAVINATVPENAPAGSEVTQVTATDYDDPLEGSNALLTYSVEKNVIDEHTGQPIFTIDADTGRITTSLCCLDRERTPAYAIQVVASDGGGLKGTGTVLVTVGDENDVSPRFSRPEWLLTVHETVPLNTSLAYLTVDDPDVTNNFDFRVVAGSGYGWERFKVVMAGDGSGALQAIRKLDYEDTEQQRGFKFQVQVSDKEESRWDDEDHQDLAWVVVTLVDDNDNPPDLTTEVVNLTLSEDTPVGRSLATFTASDKDQAGNGEIHYAIDPGSDPGRRFAVDAVGRVHLRRMLDREEVALHVVRVLAVDSGQPSLTATASLILTVTDINDNAPHVSGPPDIHVQENSGPRHVANLTLGDADDWHLGHGPPFTVKLDAEAPNSIKDTFAVDFDDKGDDGRGVAVVTSLRAVDREEAPTRLLPLVLGDAEGVTATATITVTIADVNDSPMAPGAKSVAVTRFRGVGGRIDVGRVFVDDRDDWDANQKTWAWRRQGHHSLFALDQHSGSLSMAANTPDDTYFLQFLVSDPTHNQRDVPANVTVKVKSMSRDVINCAVPIALTTHSPQELITPKKLGETPLETLLRSVENIAGVKVTVISLEAQQVPTMSISPTSTPYRAGTRLWLSARPRQPLDQLLLLNRREISGKSGVGVASVGVGACVDLPPDEAFEGARSWVVDANRTAMVSPRLEKVSGGCSCHIPRPHLPHHHHHTHSHAHSQESPAQPNVAAITTTASCQPNPCLNGGRCVVHSNTPRCVCPQGTSGSVCKQLSRHFRGNGWAWAAPIPSCRHAHISLELRTTRKESLLLYAGPGEEDLQLSSSQLLQEDVLSVELRDGRPRIMLDLGTSPVLLTPTPAIQSTDILTLADGQWHRLDVIWGKQKVEAIIDLCKQGGDCRLVAPLPPQAHPLEVSAPLQVGGLAHKPTDHQRHGWPSPLTHKAFKGCIRNLRVNGELRDLGDGVLEEDSDPGCPHHDACLAKGSPCTAHARCVKDKSGPVCDCDLGWTGASCSQRTHPASFSSSSYVKVALSAVPPPNITTLQLRFRTWERSGQLISVTSQHGRDVMSLQLIGGRVCVRIMLQPDPSTHLCLTSLHLNDGDWHDVIVERYGRWAELRVDDGDGALYNATPTPRANKDWATPLLLDRQEGIHVGGAPEYVGVSLYTVHHDFHDGCLDDVRVSGVRLPLPPMANTTSWAQATMFTNVASSCSAAPACTNVSCPEPLTCVDVWRRHECGCGDGASLTRDGTACRDINECIWSPCLNGGTCTNRDPGYICVCPKSFIGQHCEGAAMMSPSFSLSLGALLAVLVWVILLLAVAVAAYVCHRRRRRRRKTGLNKSLKEECSGEKSSGDDGEQETIADVVELSVCKEVKVNGQPPWRKNANISGVDVLRRDGPTSKGEGGTEKGCGCPHLPSLDDLRNYAYEGEGSSPGSLSSCCSGGDAGGEAKLLGGFQEVATLLNCLGGHTNGKSPSRSTHPTVQGAHLSHHSSPTSSLSTNKSHHLSSVSISNNCGTHSFILPSSQTALPLTTIAGKKYISEDITAKKNISISMSKADTLEIGIHPGKGSLDPRFHSASLASRCHSLPRSRVPTIFVNNLHTDPSMNREPLAETYHYSLKRNKAPFSGTSTAYTKKMGETVPPCCCSKVPPPPKGFEETSSSLFSRGGDVCRACVTVSLQDDDGLVGRPRRSLSASTISYLTPGPVASQSPPGSLCNHPTCSKLQECCMGREVGIRGSSPPNRRDNSCSPPHPATITSFAHASGKDCQNIQMHLLPSVTGKKH